jgi:hypothetical protein
MMTASNKTIGDLIPEVIDALQGRTDVASIAPRYIKRALQEITINYPFEELKRTGPTVALTTGQAIYPLNTFINSNDSLGSLDVPVVFVDYPNNTVTQDLKYRTPKAIEIMLAPTTQGLPSFWTRYGMNIHLGPVPDNPYSFFLRYQTRHPFPHDEAALSSAPLFISSEWEDIIIYAAAERIAVVKRWNDQQQFLHNLLFGDPDFQMSEGKRGRPGLISARLFQQERDQRYDSRRLGVVNSRYTGR